jgi:hypothetical protein
MWRSKPAATKRPCPAGQRQPEVLSYEAEGLGSVASLTEPTGAAAWALAARACPSIGALESENRTSLSAKRGGAAHHCICRSWLA